MFVNRDIIFLPKYGCSGKRSKKIDRFLSEQCFEECTKVYTSDENYWYGKVDGLLITDEMVSEASFVDPAQRVQFLRDKYQKHLMKTGIRIAVDTFGISDDELTELSDELPRRCNEQAEITILRRPREVPKVEGNQLAEVHIPAPHPNHKMNVNMMNHICKEESVTILISNAIDQKFCNTLVYNTEDCKKESSFTSLIKSPIESAREGNRRVATTGNQLNILCQYCNADTNERQIEYDFCVRSNLNNPYVECVFMLNEKGVEIPDEFKEHPKCNVIEVASWLTYKQAFVFAEQFLKNKVCGLINLDIFLDLKTTDWSKLSSQIKSARNLVFCQSRHEYDGVSKSYKDPALEKLFYCNAQDAWFFLGGCTENNPSLVEKIDFKIGLAGCDNAIADRLYNNGMVLVNSPNMYKIFHYDICRNKTGQNYMKFHKQNNKNNTHPEKNGYRLLPDIDAFPSFKHALDFLSGGAATTGTLGGGVPDHISKLSTIEQYSMVCTLFTKSLKLNND